MLILLILRCLIMFHLSDNFYSLLFPPSLGSGKGLHLRECSGKKSELLKPQCFFNKLSAAVGEIVSYSMKAAQKGKHSKNS